LRIFVFVFKLWFSTVELNERLKEVREKMQIEEIVFIFSGRRRRRVFWSFPICLFRGIFVLSRLSKKPRVFLFVHSTFVDSYCHVTNQ